MGLNRFSNLKGGLASRSSTIEDGNAHFTTSSASVLTDYHSNILGLDGILGNLGARKGLLNYDRSNTLETILKDIVNLNKDVLSSITVLVYNLPIVGKTLGPSKSLNSLSPIRNICFNDSFQLSTRSNVFWIRY